MKSQHSNPDILNWEAITRNSNVPKILAEILSQPENKCWTPIINKRIQLFWSRVKSIAKNSHRNFFLEAAYKDAKEYIHFRGDLPKAVKTHTLNILAAIYRQCLEDYKN